jgi:tRNA (guanine-N7-)-methyltransferase
MCVGNGFVTFAPLFSIMGKNKLERWRENETFALLHQPNLMAQGSEDFYLKGRWHSAFFKNDSPITLELGCGRGEYTIGMARMQAERNFIGIDIKGARLWRGAKTATEQQMPNVSFVRTRIEAVERLFAPSEINEIWLTFPDPQPAKYTKRLCCSHFFNIYKHFLTDGGAIHLKTDCRPLYDYTMALLEYNHVAPKCATADLYSEPSLHAAPAAAIQTAYEALFRSQGSAIAYLQFAMPINITWHEPPDFQFDKHVAVAKRHH